MGLRSGSTDPLAGWEFDKSIVFNSTTTLEDNTGICSSPFFSIPSGCTTIEVKAAHGNTATRRFYQASSDGTYKNGTNVRGTATITLLSDSALLRMQCATAEVDYCYILDLTHNAYIWKGQNVT